MSAAFVRIVSTAAFVIAGVACNTPAPIKSDAPPPPDETYDITTEHKVLPYTVQPGRRTLRLRTKCVACNNTHFIVSFAFDGRARPPIALTLLREGRVLTKNADRARCFEDETARDETRTKCTLLVAHGWTKLDDPGDEHTLYLIVENEGPAREAKLSFALDSVPRD